MCDSHGTRAEGTDIFLFCDHCFLLSVVMHKTFTFLIFPQAFCADIVDAHSDIFSQKPRTKGVLFRQ